MKSACVVNSDEMFAFNTLFAFLDALSKFYY